MFSRKTAGQLLARINSLALPREALESATLLPNSTLPVLTAIRICLFTSNRGLLAPFPRHGHRDLYQSRSHWYLLTDDHVAGCFDPENDSCLVDVIADCSARIKTRDFEGQGEARSFGSNYPFTLLLDNESSPDSRQAFDMVDE